MNNPSYIVNDYLCEETLYFNRVPILSYQIHYPQIYKNSKINPDKMYYIQKINMFYQEKARSLEIHCKDSLFPIGIEQYKNSKQNKFPFFPYEVISTFKVTYLQDNYFSLYQDVYTFTGGAHGSTIRSSETWNLANQQQVFLDEFFPTKSKEEIKQCITSFIIHEISLEQNKKENNMYYFKDYNKNVTEHFNENNFYLTPDGIIIYFQQYEIAPYSSGIPEFFIPLKNNGN